MAEVHEVELGCTEGAGVAGGAVPVQSVPHDATDALHADGGVAAGGAPVAPSFAFSAGQVQEAMLVTNEGSLEEAELVATKVFADLVRISKKFPNFVPTVEGIQDSVEKELILAEILRAIIEISMASTANFTTLTMSIE
jgi:hypothetical protein